MNLKTLSSEGKIAYLIKPILKVLQEAGGQLERSEIKERIADMDDQIAEYSVLEKKSKQTGNTYKEFNFKFNFAIKDLFFNGLLTFTDSSPITLTEKGLYLDIDKLDVQKEIIEPSKKHWEELSQKNKKNKAVDVSDNEEETQAEEKIKDDFKENRIKLPIHISTQASVANVESAKFLKNEGVERIVLARELSISEMKQIREEADVELEAFIHGALCYSYSGQCLFSALEYGKSANRGRCVYPCRSEFDVIDDEGKKERRHLFSMKDMALEEEQFEKILETLEQNNVDVLRITEDDDVDDEE